MTSSLMVHLIYIYPLTIYDHIYFSRSGGHEKKCTLSLHFFRFHFLVGLSIRKRLQLLQVVDFFFKMLSSFILWLVVHIFKHLLSNAMDANANGAYITAFFGSSSCSDPFIFQESFALGRCLQLINGSSIEVFCVGHDMMKHGILIHMFPSSISCSGVLVSTMYPINKCINAEPFLHNAALTGLDISSFAAICSVTPAVTVVPDYQCSTIQSPLNPISLPDSSCQSTCYDVYPQCKQPSGQPSATPTIPSGQPSRQPSKQPRAHPSTLPSRQPSRQPSATPTNPTGQPSRRPSHQPSSSPTNPSGQPSRQPSRQPSAHPTTRVAHTSALTNTCPTELIFTNPTTTNYTTVSTSTSTATSDPTTSKISTATTTTSASTTTVSFVKSNARKVVESMVDRAGSRFDVGSKQFARNKQNGEDNEEEDNENEDNTAKPSTSPSPSRSPGSSSGSGPYTRSLANHTHILVFALVQRNLAYLESFLRSVSDPDSPRYGQYMSKEEVQRTINELPYFLIPLISTPLSILLLTC